MLYHITSATAWEQAQRAGQYTPAAFAQEGFMHCSHAHQLAGVAYRYYRGQAGLVILCIEPEQATAPIKHDLPRDPATFQGLMRRDNVRQRKAMRRGMPQHPGSQAGGDVVNGRLVRGGGHGVHEHKVNRGIFVDRYYACPLML